MDDGMAIDVVDAGDDALLEFVLSMPLGYGAGREQANFEEALDQVRPGAVLGREGEVEAAWRPGVEPGSGFPRNVCGMVVEDQLDRGAGRIPGGIEKLEESMNSPAAVARSLTSAWTLPVEQIDPGQQAERAMAFVLMIRAKLACAAWHWRQIRCRRGDGLDSRLLVVRDDRDRLLRVSPPWQRLFQDLDLAVDTRKLPPSWARTRRRGVPDHQRTLQA